MRALQISYDGKLMATAGTPHATLLGFSLAWSVEEKWPWVHLSGMNEYEDARTSHTAWLMPLALQPGKTLELQLVDTDAATPPEEERYTDSDEARADRAEYEATLTGPWPPRPQMERLAPHASLALHPPGMETVVANLDDGDDWLSVHCAWSAHEPDACRISLTSNRSEDILARRKGRDWFHGKLKLGEGCRIDIGGSPGAD